MHTRVVQATIKSKRIAEFKNAVTNHDLPAIRTQPGFLGDLVMYSGASFIAITFWQSEQDAELYSQELFPRLAARSAPLVDNILRVENYRLVSRAVFEMESVAASKVETLPVRQLAAVAAA